MSGHIQENYNNPRCAHARRGLISSPNASFKMFKVFSHYTATLAQNIDTIVLRKLCRGFALQRFHFYLVMKMLY